MDFVIPWVDGNDVEWQAEKNKFSANGQGDFCPARFRDWEILKYWFPRTVTTVRQGKTTGGSCKPI